MRDFGAPFVPPVTKSNTFNDVLHYPTLTISTTYGPDKLGYTFAPIQKELFSVVCYLALLILEEILFMTKMPKLKTLLKETGEYLDQHLSPSMYDKEGTEFVSWLRANNKEGAIKRRYKEDWKGVVDTMAASYGYFVDNPLEWREESKEELSPNTFLDWYTTSGQDKEHLEMMAQDPHLSNDPSYNEYLKNLAKTLKPEKI